MRPTNQEMGAVGEMACCSQFSWGRVPQDPKGSSNIRRVQKGWGEIWASAFIVGCIGRKRSSGAKKPGGANTMLVEDSWRSHRETFGFHPWDTWVVRTGGSWLSGCKSLMKRWWGIQARDFLEGIWQSHWQLHVFPASRTTQTWLNQFQIARTPTQTWGFRRKWCIILRRWPRFRSLHPAIYSLHQRLPADTTAPGHSSVVILMSTCTFQSPGEL